MTDDIDMGGELRRAAERLRLAHPDRPYVTVTATLRLPSQADPGDCRPEYAVRAAGNGFLAWHGMAATLAEAVAECERDMAFDPLRELRAEADARGYELVKKNGVNRE
jgi:hypothetical protein